MKKILALLPLMTCMLFSCSGNTSEPKTETDNTYTPIASVARQDFQQKTFVFEGTIHFTNYYDYIVDTFGYAHVLFGPKQGDKKEPNFYQSKKDVKPTFSAKDFADGEKVCFTWGETDNYLCSMVNDIYKYDKDIVTPIVQMKGRIKEGTWGVFVKSDGTEISPFSSDGLLYLTADFKETKLDYSKEYYAYTVTEWFSEKQQKSSVLFYVEA